MLAAFKMSFEGNPHSGVDDARNIARVALAMLEKNVELGVCRVSPIVNSADHASLHEEARHNDGHADTGSSGSGEDSGAEMPHPMETPRPIRVH